MITAVAFGCVALLVVLLIAGRLRGADSQQHRRDSRERLRPLALAFAQGKADPRPALSGRDALVFAELLDELAVEVARDPSLSLEPAEPESPAIASPAGLPEQEESAEAAPVDEEDSAAPAAAPAPEEQDLAVRAAVLAKRELALARLHATLAEREREFDERAREVKEAERRLVETAAALHETSVLLDKREVALAARERSLAPPAEPAEGSDQSQAGMWDLDTLEHLVNTGSAVYPGRADEWRYYLLYLRGHAAADGRLPSSFDWLVAEVFAELLEPAAAAE